MSDGVNDGSLVIRFSFDRTTNTVSVVNNLETTSKRKREETTVKDCNRKECRSEEHKHCDKCKVSYCKEHMIRYLKFLTTGQILCGDCFPNPMKEMVNEALEYIDQLEKQPAKIELTILNVEF